MHIADGVMTTPVMVATNALAAGGVLYSMRRLSWDKIPQAGVLAAVFFLASFLHIHLGPSSVHLLLNGLLGLLLGWAALPALAVALFLQSVLLGFGGVSALGANLLCMGLPAVAAAGLLAPSCRRATGFQQAVFRGGAVGFFSTLGACVLFALLLHISRPDAYAAAIKAVVIAHVPVILIETAVIGAAVGFLYRVRPDLLRPFERRDGRAVTYPGHGV